MCPTRPGDEDRIHRPADPTSGFRCGYVAFAGAPNAGKSTLMNRLLRQKLAITSPKPQTTRRRTLGILNDSGHQMILLDTPGILEPRYPLQKAMMRTVSEVLGDVDLLCLLIDVTTADAGKLMLPDLATTFEGKSVAVVNKIDRLRSKESMLPLLQTLTDTGLFCDLVPISALEGDGVDRLLSILIGRLPLAPALYPPDQLTEHPERFFVAELVREAVFHQYAQEVPYAVEVEVTRFIERERAKDYIEATLYVEQTSQKAILIGRGGQAIRALGEAAREAIEEFLDREVYLELRVKIAPKWRKNESALRRFGYRS